MPGARKSLSTYSKWKQIYTVESRYLELWYLEFCETRSVYLNQKYILIAFCNHNWALETFWQVQITRSANWFALRVIWTCKKCSNTKLWLEKAIKMSFLIQIDASSFAEFEISEFEISRFDCSWSQCYRYSVVFCVFTGQLSCLNWFLFCDYL